MRYSVSKCHDELLQIGVNQDPQNAYTGTTENNCERLFWTCQGSFKGWARGRSPRSQGQWG